MIGKKLIFFITSWILFSSAFSICSECEIANQKYANGEFNEAAQLYQNLVNEGFIHETIYYNLGNAYYKSGDMGRAILNFERTLVYNPMNADAKFNLNMANQQITDEVYEAESIPVIDNVLGFIRKFSPDFWAYFSTFFAILSFIGIVSYILSNNKHIRIYGFFLFIISIFAVIFFWLTSADVQNFRAQKFAIIIAEEININSEPKEETKILFVLHSGTKIKVLSESSGFYKIQIADGSQGWIAKYAAEII